MPGFLYCLDFWILTYFCLEFQEHLNISFTTGVFPDVLKVSKIIPLHKGGSTLEVNNFRPISLLSIFDKIIEKLMHKRLYDFLDEHNILYEHQFGFRKFYSTGYSLIELTEKNIKYHR